MSVRVCVRARVRVRARLTAKVRVRIRITGGFMSKESVRECHGTRYYIYYFTVVHHALCRHHLRVTQDLEHSRGVI